MTDASHDALSLIDAVVGSRSVDATVELEIVPANATSLLEDAQDIVNVFQTAVEKGQFPDLSRPEQSSSLALKKQAPAPLRYEGKCRALEPAAWRVLLSTLCASHYAHEPLSRVRLRVSPVKGEEMTGKALFSWPLPARVKKTPFQVVEDETFPGSEEPLIRFEFSRKVTDEEFMELGAAITAWESLIILGGYNDSCAKRESLPFTPGELYQTSPRIAENTMFGFTARAEAFDPLINLAVAVHKTIAPIKKLELE